MIQPNPNIFEQIQKPLLRSVHPRGVIWLAGAAAFAVVGMLADWGITALLMAVTVIFYICFRNPARVMPAANDIAAAPADGILTSIDRAAWPPETALDGDATRLIINPRFYDAHVLRAPAAAALTLAQHMMGQWGSNVFDKNSPGNERMVYVMKLSDNRILAMEILGGAMAERIRTSARAGDVLTLGQEIGYSAFGGEVRLYLPENCEVTAQPGQRMIAGETAIAALDVVAVASGYAPLDDINHFDEMSSNDMGVLPNSAGFRF